MKPLKVLIAPDYRELAPYQSLLTGALSGLGVQTEYMSGTRRGLPLTRGVAPHAPDVLHLHWFGEFARNNPRDVMRRLRFPLDLRLTARRTPVVYTVHDLFPTGWPETPLNHWLVSQVLHNVAALIVHSAGAQKAVCETFRVPQERCIIIPHGDQTPAYGPPMPRNEARARLGLGGEKICLAFGRVIPSKGMAELVEWWARAQPGATLVVAGDYHDQGFVRRINLIAAGSANIDLRFGFQSDRQVNAWFSAADCAVTNYHTIFSSGVACLARSWGVPLLLPHHLATLDLMEPDPSILRYTSLESDFAENLQRSLAIGANYDRAAAWRKATGWDAIATQTAQVYHRAVKDHVKKGKPGQNGAQGG